MAKCWQTTTSAHTNPPHQCRTPGCNNCKQCMYTTKTETLVLRVVLVDLLFFFFLVPAWLSCVELEDLVGPSPHWLTGWKRTKLVTYLPSPQERLPHPLTTTGRHSAQTQTVGFNYFNKNNKLPTKTTSSAHSCQPLLGVNLSPEFVNLYFPYAGWGLVFFAGTSGILNSNRHVWQWKEEAMLY